MCDESMSMSEASINSPRKVPIRDMFGSNQTPAGKAAVRRAMEYAAKEQEKILEKAKNL